jgi:hypothetical protein
MIVEQIPSPQTVNWPQPAHPPQPFPWDCEPRPNDTRDTPDKRGTVLPLTGWPRVFPGL